MLTQIFPMWDSKRIKSQLFINLALEDDAIAIS